MKNSLPTDEDAHRAAPSLSFPTSLAESEFNRLLHAGLIIDGRMGGVVLGRSLEDGGVPVIFKFGSEFVIGMRVEGGDFIMNAEAAAVNHSRIAALKTNLIPAEKDDGGALGAVQMLLTRAHPHDKFIWADWGSLAISKEIAAKHIGELFRLNWEQNPYFSCDLLAAINGGNGKEDVAS